MARHRGYISRRQLHQELIAQWLKDFASVAASASKPLPAKVIQGILCTTQYPMQCRSSVRGHLNPAVGGHEQRRSCLPACMLHKQEDLIALDLVCAEKVLPPILFACLPPFSRRSEAALVQGAAVTLQQATEASALRGMLALLLRSIAATDSDLNYFSLASDPSHK